MIHVIQGDGKGKTTAAVGLCVRAAGNGLPVLFAQFLKDDSSGEVAVLRSLPQLELLHCPVNYGFTFQMTEAQKRETAAEYEKMLDRALASGAFLIVLDELIHALNAGLVRRQSVERLLDKPCELVLTGRDAPDWLLARADYISEIRKLRHPYDRGVEARPGVEF